MKISARVHIISLLLILMTAGAFGRADDENPSRYKATIELYGTIETNIADAMALRKKGYFKEAVKSFEELDEDIKKLLKMIEKESDVKNDTELQMSVMNQVDQLNMENECLDRVNKSRNLYIVSLFKESYLPLEVTRLLLNKTKLWCQTAQSTREGTIDEDVKKYVLQGPKEEIHEQILELYTNLRTNIIHAMDLRRRRSYDNAIEQYEHILKGARTIKHTVANETGIESKTDVDINLLNRVETLRNIEKECLENVERSKNLYVVGLYDEIYTPLDVVIILIEKCLLWANGAKKLSLFEIEIDDLPDGSVLSEPDAIFEEALLRFSERDYPAAKEKLEEALDESADHRLSRLYYDKITEVNSGKNNAFDRGIKLFKERNYSDAVNRFKDVLAIEPKNQDAEHYVKLIVKKAPEEKQKDIVDNIAKRAYKQKDMKKAGNIFDAEGCYRVLKTMSPEDKKIKKAARTHNLIVSNETRNQKAINYIRAGDISFQNKEYKKALYFYKKALMYADDAQEITRKINFARDPDSFTRYIEEKKRKESEEEARLQAERDRKKRLAEMESDILAKLSRAEMLSKGNNLNNLRQAQKLVNEVLEIDPENQRANDLYQALTIKIAKIQNYSKFKSQLDAYLNRGMELYKQKRYREALDEFEVALQLDPGNKTAKSMIARLQQLLAQENEKSQRAEIEKNYQIFEKGLFHYHADQFKEAVSAFTEFLKFVPDDKEAKKYLELAKQGLRQQMEEEVDINSPFFYIVQNLLREGEEYVRVRQYKKAKDVFEQVLKIFPRNKEAKQHYIRCFKNLDPAIFNNFLAERYQMGVTLLKNNKKREAAAEFELILSISPTYKDAEMLLYRAKETTKAKEVAKKVEEKKKIERKKRINPQAVQQLYDMGLSFYQKKKYRDAKNAWNRALALDPDHIKSQVGLKKLSFVDSFNKSGGTSIASRARTGSSAKVKSLYARGLMYYNLNQYQAAIREWKQVLKLDPGHTMAIKNIKRCEKILKFTSG